MAFPGGRWATEGPARLRFSEDELSVSKFRLASEGQVLAVDGGRHGEDIAAHLALTGLRLERLPAALIDPKLKLDGELGVDVKAEGRIDAPKVVARVALKQARYQGLSKIDATVEATLHDDVVEGTVGVEAPFASADAELKVPTDPLAPGAPIALKVDIKHLDVGQLLRAAEAAAPASGRLNLKLRLDGSADDPRLDLAVQAFEVGVKKPSEGACGDAPLGRGRTGAPAGDLRRSHRARGPRFLVGPRRDAGGRREHPGRPVVSARQTPHPTSQASDPRQGGREEPGRGVGGTLQSGGRIAWW